MTRIGDAAGRRGLAWAAWLTHFYTALGAVLAFVALGAIVSGDIRAAFLLLAAATAVDSSDGLLARAVRVRERTPQIDGARLDDIVDYVTFVFVPAFLLYSTGRLPAGWGLAVACAMLLSSAIAFSRSDAKTADHFFTGFPSYWNVVAFYMVAFGTPPIVNGVLLATLCLLVFVPVGYVYPTRTPTLRGITLLLGGAWGALVLYLMWQLPAFDRRLLWISLAYPAYYLVLSFALHSRRGD